MENVVHYKLSLYFTYTQLLAISNLIEGKAMVVVTMWKCDQDDSMFDNKKDADAYDKMLELAEGFTLFLEKHADGINKKMLKQSVYCYRKIKNK